MKCDELLQQLYQNALSDKSIILQNELNKDILNIAKNAHNQKGVFTVLITLLVYKIKLYM